MKMSRTPEDFVEEMIGKGRDWIEIDVSSSAIRGGTWKEKVTDILLEKGMMPVDQNERIRLKTERTKQLFAEKIRVEKEKMAEEKERRKHGHFSMIN